MQELNKKLELSKTEKVNEVTFLDFLFQAQEIINEQLLKEAYEFPQGKFSITKNHEKLSNKHIKDLTKFHDYLKARLSLNRNGYSSSETLRLRFSVLGFASPEGKTDTNFHLSKNRSYAIANHLLSLSQSENFLFCPIPKGELTKGGYLDTKEHFSLGRIAILQLDCIEFNSDQRCERCELDR